MRSFHTLVLAAGYATRLYPLTENQPKCLLQVGSKTILDRILDQVPEAGSDRHQTYLVTNSKFYDQLQQWAKNQALARRVQVMDDGTTSNDSRLGAIGDMQFALSQMPPGKDVLLLASDNLFENSLEPFIRFAQEKNEVTIGMYDIGDRSLAAGRYGVIVPGADHRVREIEEKPASPSSSYIGMGIYYFPEKILHRIVDYLASKDALDAPGHFIAWLVQKSVSIYCFEFGGLWYDIGDLNALEKARKHYSQNL